MIYHHTNAFSKNAPSPTKTNEIDVSTDVRCFEDLLYLTHAKHFLTLSFTFDTSDIPKMRRLELRSIICLIMLADCTFSSDVDHGNSLTS